MISKINCSNILSTSSLKLTSLSILIAPVSLLLFSPANYFAQLPSFALSCKWNIFLCFNCPFVFSQKKHFFSDQNYNAVLFMMWLLKRKIVRSGPNTSVICHTAIGFRNDSHLLSPAGVHSCNLISLIPMSVWYLCSGAVAPLMHLKCSPRLEILSSHFNEQQMCCCPPAPLHQASEVAFWKAEPLAPEIL